MKKNLVKTVRVNDEVFALLQRQGWTAQELFDWAVAQKVSVETKVTMKAVKAKGVRK